MLMSIFAWVLRFGLFGIGNPGEGLFLLFLSMVVYGMAFDFFNISGSLFVEKEADIKIRASAQGLFMMMTNGVGAFLGTLISGKVVDYFTTKYYDLNVLVQSYNITPDNPWLADKLKGKVVSAGHLLNEPILVRDWQSIWFSFAGYALVLGIIFPLVFKYRHDPKELEHIHH
jgi:NHS family xanthosine MFS transporter